MVKYDECPKGKKDRNRTERTSKEEDFSCVDGEPHNVTWFNQVGSVPS